MLMFFFCLAAMSNYLIYFPHDKQFTVIKEKDIVSVDFNWDGKKKYMTVEYDGVQCRAIMVQEGMDEMTTTLKYVRQLQFEKHLSIDAILDSLSTNHGNKRQKFIPLNVSFKPVIIKLLQLK
jgi:hypothetical protein